MRRREFIAGLGGAAAAGGGVGTAADDACRRFHERPVGSGF